MKQIIILEESDMDEKYRAWHKIQIISCIGYALFIICMYFMMYTDMPSVSIIVTAVLAAVSLITTMVSGLIRAYIGHKMGLKSTKKDLVIIGIALILSVTYFVVKSL